MDGGTNVPIINRGGSGSGGTTGADLPTHLSSLSANPGNKFVTLTLGYTNTSYVSGVQVNYKTGSYPTSPSDGNSMTVTDAQTSIKVEGLTNALTYYFRVFLYNEVDGVKCYQTDITNARVTAIPRAVEITGIIPLAQGSNYIVITQSGSGTISAPAGTTIILGSGAASISNVSNDTDNKFYYGGFVNSVTLPNDVNSQSFTATIATNKNNNNNGTKIQIGSALYNCGRTTQIIQSKWGPIGGVGGRGGCFHREYEDPDWVSSATSPTGAGGGGGGMYFLDYKTPYTEQPSLGGNSTGFGNKGGNGGAGGTPGLNGSNGSSGMGGAAVGRYGGGGGGGYAASGGFGGSFSSYNSDDDEAGEQGEDGTGIIVIQWDN